MRILLVEDNPDDEYLIIRGLQRAGIPLEFTTAHDGVEALQMLFGDPPNLPDLLVLDLHLPKLSGLAVLRRIRTEKSGKKLPVVILTSSDDQKLETACYSAGATYYLQKGLDTDHLTNDFRSIYEAVMNRVEAAHSEFQVRS